MSHLEEDFKKFETISREDLYIELGKSLEPTEGMSVRPKKDIEYQFIGQRFFFERKKEIRKLICNKNLLNKLKKSDKKIALAIIIAETLSSLFVGIPLITISWLIVQIGIEDFCQCNDEKK